MGWDGEDGPRFVIPAICMDNHGQAMPAGSLAEPSGHTETTDWLVGHDAQQALLASLSKSGGATALYPVDRGEITDW